MKQDNETIGLMMGKCDKTAESVCRSLAKEGISAIVRQKETAVAEPAPAADDMRHWSGQPGKDLFFNGWKLLF